MNPQEIFIISASENSKLRTDLSNLFTAVGGCYGYRRLHALLKKSDVTISEKVVRRLMSEEGLVVRRIKHRKYSSYIGEISPEVANIINRDFHAEQPNERNGLPTSQSLVFLLEKYIFPPLLTVLTA